MQKLGVHVQDVYVHDRKCHAHQKEVDLQDDCVQQDVGLHEVRVQDVQELGVQMQEEVYVQDIQEPDVRGPIFKSKKAIECRPQTITLPSNLFR